jgi:hypothetical protein
MQASSNTLQGSESKSMLSFTAKQIEIITSQLVQSVDEQGVAVAVA